MEGRAVAKHVCKGDHEHHICNLAGKKQFEDIRWLATEPKFMCYNCGRAAKKGENLCNPVNIDMVWYI